MLMFTVYVVHVLISFFLIAVVLLQQGKGADLSVFGGGGTQTAFGARGAATVLHKLTVGSFILFIITTLTIGVFQGQSANTGGLGDLPEAEESAATDEPEPEAEGALPVGDDADATDADATEGAIDGEADPAADTAAEAAEGAEATDAEAPEAGGDGGESSSDS
ncbi:MAG: preprotein translocase subunit SecG [Acidobacteriota bacterium]